MATETCTVIWWTICVSGCWTPPPPRNFYPTNKQGEKVLRFSKDYSVCYISSIPRYCIVFFWFFGFTVSKKCSPILLKNPQIIALSSGFQNHLNFFDYQDVVFFGFRFLTEYGWLCIYLHFEIWNFILCLALKKYLFSVDIKQLDFSSLSCIAWHSYILAFPPPPKIKFLNWFYMFDYKFYIPLF